MRTHAAGGPGSSVLCQRMQAHAQAYFHGGAAVHPLSVPQIPVGAPAPRIHDARVTEPYRVLRPAGHGCHLDTLCSADT